MDKTLKLVLVFLLAAVPCGGQQFLKQMLQPAPSGCTAPTGAHVTETFGDASTLCWTAGPSTCNRTWTIGAGTAQSIVTSPIGAPANTACANSLQMSLDGTGNYYIASTFTAITTSNDWIGTIYVSTFPTTGNSDFALCLTTTGGTCDSSGAIAALQINNATTPAFAGYGSTSSATVAASASTWYTFDLHWDTTAANCSIAINGGAAQTFTCNTGNPTTIYVGPEHYGTTAMNFKLGNIYF
jgi:hypothetical protein